jgi:hypothetical protein
MFVLAIYEIHIDLDAVVRSGMAEYSFPVQYAAESWSSFLLYNSFHMRRQGDNADVTSHIGLPVLSSLSACMSSPT